MTQRFRFSIVYIWICSLFQVAKQGGSIYRFAAATEKEVLVAKKYEGSAVVVHLPVRICYNAYFVLQMR